MATNSGQDLARRLAAHVESRFVGTWDQGPHVALLGLNDAVDTVNLRSLSEPADVSIARLPKEVGVAACVSALGYIALCDGGGPQRRRARITVAITCCSASSVLRYTDGRVDRADDAEGSLVDALRSWASLERCSRFAADAGGCGSPIWKSPTTPTRSEGVASNSRRPELPF